MTVESTGRLVEQEIKQLTLEDAEDYLYDLRDHLNTMLDALHDTMRQARLAANQATATAPTAPDPGAE